ncbi:hypothetical protein CcaverHIS631_0701250 [Cutaneotrichosporon cavernicola]|nr:hypothetical protein CcaverHIS631_0701250 [Cutaneotrichosporon cavernicola]
MEEEKEQDLSHIHWQWPEAIAANPARSLANADLAIDYFAFSPFWDPQSNNGVLRTQNIATPGYGSAQEKIDLLGLTGGFEYVKEEKKDNKKDDLATPDWHLFNAMAATRAALPGLKTLAASARPEHDTAAEAKALEALAASSVRRPNAPPPNRQPSPLPMGTPAGGFAALSPIQAQGTPSFTPRSRIGSISLVGGLSRPASTFAPSMPADSPKL